MNKKLIMSILLVLLSFSSSIPVFAAPSKAEIEQLSNSLGWTEHDLENYLSFKEMKLTDFDNIKELKECLGTPITPNSLEHLLHSYHMTREELDILLAGFNEKVQDFWFIEDLDVAIDFYQNHETIMTNLEQFLISVGINETEKKQLYNHFKQLDQEVLNNKVYEWKKALGNFDTLDQDETLTKIQQKNLVSLWKDVINTLALQPIFYTVDDNGKRTELSIQTFLKDKSYDTLTLELQDKQNNVLIDTVISPEKLSSRFAVDAADKVIQLSELSGELSTLYQSQLPNTATFHPLFLFLGYMLILLGILFVFRKRKKNIHDE
ncbi:MAG: processed acidic surface protein [Bacillus sp. (in: firmicutes)]